MTIRAFYDRWPQYNRRLTEVVAAMSEEQLAVPARRPSDGRHAARGGRALVRRRPPAAASRASILQRVLTHDTYHCGELSQTLGIEGLPQIDRLAPERALIRRAVPLTMRRSGR